MYSDIQKIYIVSEYIHECENSTGYFWSRVINKVSTNKFKSASISPFFNQKYADLPTPNHDFIVFKKVNYNKNRLLSRIFGQLLMSWRFSSSLVKNLKRGDIVISGTNPALMLIIIPLLKKVLKFKWVLLVHDVYPDNLIPSGIIANKKVFIYRVLSRYFDWVYQNANRIVVIGRDMEQALKHKVKGKVAVKFIPNWVGQGDVCPLSKCNSKLINELQWQDKTVFQFFGNFGRVQGIDNLLAAISQVVSEHAAFVFIGSGAKENAINDFIQSHPHLNVANAGPLSPNEKIHGLAACDVAIVTLSEGMAGLGVPSKAYFSMAADRKVLAVMEDSSEVALMVKEHDIGWVCPPGNSQALATMIDDITQSFNPLMGNSPRKIFEQHYHENDLLNDLMDLLHDV